MIPTVSKLLPILGAIGSFLVAAYQYLHVGDAAAAGVSISIGLGMLGVTGAVDRVEKLPAALLDAQELSIEPARSATTIAPGPAEAAAALATREAPLWIGAGSGPEADRYLADRGIDPAKARYLSRAADPIGSGEPTVVLTGTWARRNDLVEVEAAAVDAGGAPIHDPS